MATEDADPNISHAASGMSDDAIACRERRQSRRTTLVNLAYVHLHPDSGAIVLNVSESGICFYAVGPIHQTGTIRLYLSLRPHDRIEVAADLVWTDTSKKMGGLKFASLPHAAREQIQTWILQSNLPQDQGKTAGTVPVSDSIPAGVTATGACAPVSDSVHVRTETYALRTATDAAEPPGKLHTVFQLAHHTASAVAAYAASLIPAKSRSFFIRGFVAGSAISIVLAAVLLLRGGSTGSAEVHSIVPPHGESTILPSRQAITENTAKPPDSLRQLSEEIAKLEAEYQDYDDHASTTSRRTTSTKPAPATPEAPPSPSQHIVKPIEPLTAPATAEPQPQKEAAAESTRADSTPNTAHLFESTPALRSGNHLLSPPSASRQGGPLAESKRYLEAGSFKQVVWAEHAADMLLDLGFNTQILHKTRLWMNSYQVLVGPYFNEHEIAWATSQLMAHGFKPRLTKFDSTF